MSTIKDTLHEKRKTTEYHIKQLQHEGKQGIRYTAMMPDIPFLILGLISDIGWLTHLIAGIIYFCGNGFRYLLFAESLGCGPAVFLKASPNIQIGRMILSGPEYLDFGVLNRLILKVMPKKQYRTAHEKYMPAWALRFMGQTEQGMQTMLRRIPDHISLESVRATWEAGLYLYRTDFLVQPDAKVACWYGEKEGHMKKAIQRLRTAYPGLIVRCFPGFGHGEIINHPALLASEMERFLADGETEGDALKN